MYFACERAEAKSGKYTEKRVDYAVVTRQDARYNIIYAFLINKKLFFQVVLRCFIIFQKTNELLNCRYLMLI